MAYVIKTGQQWIMAMMKALGIDAEVTPVRRIVIDAKVGEPVMMYVECFASTKVLDVELPDPTNVQVKIV